MNKIQRIIYIIFFSSTIIILNIMKVVTLSEGSSFNLALSDVLLPLVAILLLISLKNYKFRDVFKSYYLMIGLIAWLTLTSLLAIYSNEIINHGYLGYLSELIKTVICIGYFFIGYNVLRYMRKEWFFRLWAVSTTIFLGVGFSVRHTSYFLGTYTDPNHAATYLIVTFLIMLWAIQFDHKKIFKGLYGILAVLSVAAVLYTDSRGGLIGLIGSIVIFIGLNFIKRQTQLFSAIIIVGIVILIALSLDHLVSGGTYIVKLINSLIDFEKGFEIRFNLANTARLMGNDHFILGVGRGNYQLNSLPYFEQMGAAYIDNIPHNTFIGLYAEVGVVGLLLYMSPIFMMLRAVCDQWKTSKEWLSKNRFFFNTLIAIAVGVGIQALVLNVENQRSLWLLSGVFLYMIEHNKVEGIQQKTEKKLMNVKRVNGVLAIVFILLLVYSSFNVYIESRRIEVTNVYYIQIPVRQEDVGQSLLLEYTIDTIQKGFEGDAVKMSIVEESKDGQKNIRDSYIYSQTYGNAQRAFIKKEESSIIYLQFEKLSEQLEKYYILPKRVVSADSVFYLTRQYYLMPNVIQNKLRDSMWEIYEGEALEQKLGIPLGIKFEDEISLDQIKVIEDTGEKFIKVHLTCLKDIEEDYVFWMYGIPDNLHNLDPSRFSSNNVNYAPIEPVVTSEWRAGKSYIVTYRFPRNYGWYQLRCGLYYKKGDEVIRLYNPDTNLPYADLGWVDMNEK